MDTTFDFVKEIKNPSEYVCKYFDELMVLYHLVGVIDDTSLCLDKNSTDVTFKITMKTKDDAIELFNRLNGTSFCIYDTKFSISMHRKRNAVYTSVYKNN